MTAPAKALTEAQMRRRLLPSEQEFQDQIVDIAHAHGWFVAHWRGDLHRIAQYDAEGFPDLLMLRESRGIIAAEIKGAKTPVAPAQFEWLETFRFAGAKAFLWRVGVDSLESIEEILR